MPKAIQIPEPMRIDASILPGQNAGVLGARWNPFSVQVTRAGEVVPPNFARVEKVTENRLRRRRELLGLLENQSLVDNVPAEREFTALQQRVMRILQRPSIQNAFDVDREPSALHDAYGRNRHGQSTLLARRLIEAGSRFVTVYWGKEIQDWGGPWKPMLVNNPWDTHRNHFPLIKESLIPRADQALAALLSDLSERGLLDETLVVWMGEVGRSPRISKIFATPGARTLASRVYDPDGRRGHSWRKRPRRHGPIRGIRHRRSRVSGGRHRDDFRRAGNRSEDGRALARRTASTFHRTPARRTLLVTKRETIA